MPKFLFVYRSSAQQSAEQPSPEQMQEIMGQWGKWMEKVGAALVDGGDGLMPTGKVVNGGAVTDGPFIEAKELVGGFSIVEADDYDGAVAYAKSCPAAENGSVEVRELAGFAEN